MHAVTHHTLQCSWCMCRADQDLPPGISLPIDIPRSTCAIRVAAAGSVVVAVVAAAAAAAAASAKHVRGLTRPSGRS